MKITTTTIGAFPKPKFLPITDWFTAKGGTESYEATLAYEADVKKLGPTAEAKFIRAAEAVINDQVRSGIDIVTDGEVRRENYVHYHCRHLDGIDFSELSEAKVRGVYTTKLPTIYGPIRSQGAFLTHDWIAAQSLTDNPVKVTMPGPMTMGDTLADAFYENKKVRGLEIAIALNKEILKLADAGCRYIQIDEPLFARNVDDAINFGFDHIEACFHNCPNHVTRTIHMCCGYPDKLDNLNYPKAPKNCYFELATAIDESSLNAVSIEDAHRPNDLCLLERFQNTSIILGVVSVACSTIESVASIEARIKLALNHIEARRLLVAPDCGLGLLSRKLALKKLKNIGVAVQRI